jgi:hypothetical protein
MSHSVNIKTQFKEVNLLLKTFESMGWMIVENAKCKTYPSDPSKDIVHRYVAKNPKGGYDVGIDLDQEGMAKFTCDFYDRSIAEQLGANLQAVKQGYAMNQVKRFIHEEDLNYTVETLPTGELKVIATK